MKEGDSAIHHQFVNIVILNIDVFHSVIDLGFVGDLDSTNVVGKQCSRKSSIHEFENGS